MNLSELKDILKSGVGAVQFAIVYDMDEGECIASGCSVEYAVSHFGERNVKRISAHENYLVIYLR